MARTAQKHIVDRLTEIVGAASFASAMAWATLVIQGVPAAAVVGVLCLISSFWLISSVGHRRATGPMFWPIELTFPAHDETGDPSDAAASGDDELLLEDELKAAPDSRVVRLFAADSTQPAALVARIEDYLDRAPSRREVEQRMRRDEPVPDASAALHAALANIRASLR